MAQPPCFAEAMIRWLTLLRWSVTMPSMATKLSEKNLAVLGTGKLGGILLRAYLKQGMFTARRVTATVRHEEKAAKLSKELGVKVSTDNRRAVKDADIILLGVK